MISTKQKRDIRSVNVHWRWHNLLASVSVRVAAAKFGMGIQEAQDSLPALMEKGYSKGKILEILGNMMGQEDIPDDGLEKIREFLSELHKKQGGLLN